MRNNTEKNLWCNLGETEEKLAGKAAKKKGGKLFQEILSFFGLRVASGIASFFLLVLLVDVLGLTHTMGWVLSSAINLIVNYIGSKFFIFRS